MAFPKEELLHHIWQHRLFSSQALRTVDGMPLEVIRPGEMNTDSGPDFRNSRIRANGAEWAGNVEIHVRTSDWLRHSHHHDPAYANIILHVVFEHDLEEVLGTFPTLELKPLISDQLLRRYEHLRNSSADLPCGHQFMEVPELVRSAWLDSLLIGRLQRKSAWMHTLVDDCHGDLEQAFMMVLFRSFGMKVNAEPFEQLAKRTPWKVLAKHQDNLFQLEAILFGNAGHLQDAEDEYQERLRTEYEFLRHKYELDPLDAKVWKFLRLRPANFPTVRLAQLAALFQQTGAFLRWFSDQGKRTDPKSLQVTPSAYWNTHYRFGTESPRSSKRLGPLMAHNMLINAVAPFLFVMAEREANDELRERSLSLLQNLQSERNSKVRSFENLGMKVPNAAESQALIELKTNFCDLKKCLICNVGANILKREP